MLTYCYIGILCTFLHGLLASATDMKATCATLLGTWKSPEGHRLVLHRENEDGWLQGLYVRRDDVFMLYGVMVDNTDNSSFGLAAVNKKETIVFTADCEQQDQKSVMHTFFAARQTGSVCSGDDVSLFGRRSFTRTTAYIKTAPTHRAFWQQSKNITRENWINTAGNKIIVDVNADGYFEGLFLRTKATKDTVDDDDEAAELDVVYGHRRPRDPNPTWSMFFVQPRKSTISAWTGYKLSACGSHRHERDIIKMSGFVHQKPNDTGCCDLAFKTHTFAANHPPSDDDMFEHISEHHQQAERPQHCSVTSQPGVIVLIITVVLLLVIVCGLCYKHYIKQHPHKRRMRTESESPIYNRRTLSEGSHDQVEVPFD